MPPEELGVGAEVQKNIKVVLCSEVTLSRGILAHTLIADHGSSVTNDGRESAGRNRQTAWMS